MSNLFGCSFVNDVVGSSNLCTGEIEYGTYGFLISQGAAWFFTIAFAVSLLLHIGQAVRYRTWSLLWTAAACSLAEMLGWIARLESALSVEWYPQSGGYYTVPNDTWFLSAVVFTSNHPNSNSFVLVQISTLIIGPAFLAAACYIILGWLIHNLGEEYSLLRPRTYIWLFVSGDILSLVIQAAGGGVASSANTQSLQDTGAWIMFGGIVWQIVVMVGFFVVITNFIYRLWKCSNVLVEIKPKLLLVAIYMSMVFVFIRCAYRVAELSQGWDSDIIHNQALFNALDGAMMVVAVYLVNIFHPGRLLKYRSRSSSIRSDTMELKA